MLQKLHGWCGTGSLMVDGGVVMISTFIERAEELVDCICVTGVLLMMGDGKGDNVAGGADLVR